jgi:hypothetical protein
LEELLPTTAKKLVVLFEGVQRMEGIEFIIRFGYVYFNIFKNFLFSSLQIVSSSHHNSEYEVRKKQNGGFNQNSEVGKVWYFFFYRLHSLIYDYYENVTEQK